MPKYLTLAIVVALVAAACSSSPADDSPTSAKQDSTPSTASTAPTTTAAPTTKTSTSVPATTTTKEDASAMELTSPAFEPGDPIPARFNCFGEGISPELAISNVPEGTVTLALIMDDPDAPGGTWVHWVAFDFPPTDVIPEGIPLLGIGGNNSWGVTGYGGPCPPSSTHRYFFKVFALDGTLELPEGSTKEEVLDAMEGRILGEAVLMGRVTKE